MVQSAIMRSARPKIKSTIVLVLAKIFKHLPQFSENIQALRFDFEFTLPYNNMLHPSRVGRRVLKLSLLTRLGEHGRYALNLL